VLSKSRLETRGLARAPNHAVAILGYGEAGEFEPEYPDPLAPVELPSPDERIEEYREFIAAQSLNQIGRYAEAAAKLEALLEHNPGSLHALDELAVALVESEQWSRAIPVLLERVHRPPARLLTHQRLVQCYTALGDTVNSRLQSLRALELLIEVHERRGERDLVARYRKLYDGEVGSLDK
jgi:tetratricopeptide (TPR) repeat protein